MQFRVDMDPVGKARARVTYDLPVPGRVRARKAGHHWYTPKTTSEAEETIRYAYFIARWKQTPPPMDAPIKLTVYADFIRPKHSLREMPTVKPDADNILKLVGDALNKVAWVDDCQIIAATVIKSYAEPGMPPGLEISIEECKE